MSFGLTLAALTALAIALLLVPLRRQQNDPPTVSDDQLRRLREFEADVAADDIDPSVAQDLRTELERAVLEALPASAAAPATNRRGRGLLATLCLSAPLCALGLYWQLGSPDLALYSASHPLLDWRKQASSIDFFVERLRQQLADNPADINAWTLLTRTEMQLGHYREALAAAQRLNLVAPQQASAILLLVDALLMNGGEEHHSRAQALTAKVLGMEPQNPTALVMKGMFLQQEGDAAGALRSSSIAIMCWKAGLRALSLKAAMARLGLARRLKAASRPISSVMTGSRQRQPAPAFRRAFSPASISVLQSCISSRPKVARWSRSSIT